MNRIIKLNEYVEKMREEQLGQLKEVGNHVFINFEVL